jgi:N-acyl-phosphatidylethanolamine-hydrolysing phospholipase D
MDRTGINKNISLKAVLIFIVLPLIFITGCSSFFIRFLGRSIGNIPFSPDTVSLKVDRPVLPKVGLSLLWAGHSTCLIQIGDKVFLTDPIFTNTAGMISKRKIESGLLPSSITKLDFVLISHLHFDHLSYGSLSMIPPDVAGTAQLILPPDGFEYTPEFGFSDYREMDPWTVYESDGVRITAVPVRHFNGRYGIDISWLKKKTYTGYVIEYQGKTVLFAGDTGYDPEIFKQIGKKFTIDLALIPIAPVEPHDFMKRVHTDYIEGLQVFYDLNAKIMIPIHHSTFEQGLDSSLTYAREKLSQIVRDRNLEDKVKIPAIGEQLILIEQPPQ